MGGACSKSSPNEIDDI